MSEVRLKHVCRVIEARAGSEELQLLAVSIHRGVVPRNELTGDEPRAEDLTAYRLCEAGDIVLNRMRAFQGGVGMAPQRGMVSPDYLVLRPAPFVSSRYLHHLLRSTAFVGEMISRLRGIGSTDTGSVRTPRINAEDLLNIRIDLPPLDRQRTIADYLDGETARTDALISAKRQMIALLRDRWNAERSHALLADLDPVTGHGTQPYGWDVRSLGATVALQRGHDLPTDARLPGAVPVVSSGGISGSHDLAACDPPGVVTGRYGTIGKVFYMDSPYWPLNTTLFVSDFRGNLPRWVFHLLSALPLAFDEEKSAVTGINRNVIGVLRVAVPPVEKQIELAAVLDEEQKLNAKLRALITDQIQLLQQRRQALIAAVVTGQADVPVAA